MMFDDYEILKAVFEVVGFLGGVIYAVGKIVRKTDMLGDVIKGLAREVGELRKSINEITHSHADHSLRIVRLETVLEQNGNGKHRQN